MPFPAQEPNPFTRESALRLTEKQMGCYGLVQIGKEGAAWIYIGKGDIRQRLLDHIGGDNPCITRYLPTHWYGVVTSDYDNKEKQLIREFDPHCNKKVG